MPDDSRQLEMLGAKAEPMPVEVQEEIARRCTSRHDALVKCFTQSGLRPGQVAGPLGISDGQFSKIVHGSKFLNPEQLYDFMDQCGNEIPLRYDAYKRRYDLVPKRTTAEERIRELESENADLRRAMKLVGEVMRGER